MLFGPAHEVIDLVGVPGKLELSGEFWEDGCTTKSKSLVTKQKTGLLVHLNSRHSVPNLNLS